MPPNPVTRKKGSRPARILLLVGTRKGAFLFWIRPHIRFFIGTEPASSLSEPIGISDVHIVCALSGGCADLTVTRARS